ncbi:cytochrome B [Alteromonas pelagimontana]|uniref:Cytochrome B n=2 Tax=Alteromonas pelagimontana TaxID=1858656 RepID=A0A6M4MHZ0_9ALTE|nr:cytochrome B [Alteromonas pelagimontana]
MEKRLIWDLPTRLFHWLLVITLIVQYVTAEVLDDAMQWHFYAGYFALGLILFRILWGLAGTDYARFSHFVKGPVTVLRYACNLFNRDSPAHTGHNPLGGWMVILMLALIATQAVSGLFLTDDVFLDGPYRSAVSEATQDTMNFLHHNVFNVLLALIALHIAAIIFYAIYKKQRLAPSMIHGKKATEDKAISSSKLLLAALLIALSAATVYYAVEIAPPAPVDDGAYY